MKELRKIKLALKKFAGRNEALLMPLLKFLLTLLALSRISNKIGFMARLTSKPIILIIALAGSFLPLNLTLVIIGFVIIAHMYALGLEVAIVVFALFLVLYLLYFRFASRDSIAGVLTPLAFAWKMPFVMPVSMGLVGTPSSMVSVGAGVVIYNILHFISVNSDMLLGGEETTKLGQFKIIIDALIGNKAMIVYAASFALTVLVVFLIRKMTIKYAWQIAIVVGELTLLFVTLLANAVLNAGISGGSVFVGVIVSTAVNFFLQFFLFDLNYNRIEKVQFEDDEYYYYVKAVPKNEFAAGNGGKKKKAPVKRPAPSQRTAIRTQPAQGTVRETAPEKARTADRVPTQAERTAAAIRNAESQNTRPVLRPTVNNQTSDRNDVR